MSKEDKWLKLFGGSISCGTTGWTSVNLFLEQSPDLVEVSTSSSEEPGMTAAGTAVVSTFASSTGGPDAVLELPGAIIEVFFKNQVPYTTTEKRAEQVYGALHRNSEKMPGKPMLIAESREALEAAVQAFGSARGECVMEDLELFEELLEGVANKEYSN